MTVTAPPRTPRPSHPVECKELEALVEALIEEARQRARRRRRIYAASVALVALVVVAVSTVVDRATQPDTASPALAARSSGLAGAATPKIAFIREPQGGYAGVLWVMNPDGSGQRRLGPAFPDMDWSLDGQKIAFTTWGDRQGSGGGDIYVTNADGSGRKRLTTSPGPDSNPAWSPDGRRIAFASGRDGKTGIYVMNPDGTEQRLLMPAKASYPPHLTWSPDGEKIAFTVALGSGRDGNLEINVMNADGSGQRRLTRSTVRDSYPVWSPDGRSIAFESNWQIWVTNADGSPAPRRLTHNGGRNFNPAWSPDGQRIVFEHRRRQGTSHWVGAWGYKVYVMNVDGSGQRRLMHGGSQPRWSPDGRKIAFVTKRDRDTDIYVMNADGSGQRNLTRTPGGSRRESSPVWSPAQK